MARITLRGLPDEVHRALRVRAAMHGRSIEAEIRDILEAAVRPPERVRMGTALADLSRRAGLTNEDVAALEQAGSQKAAEPLSHHLDHQPVEGAH